MPYRKREIDLPIEVDFEFRRIEGDVSPGEVVKKIIYGGSSGDGQKILYSRRDFYMNGGENRVIIEPYVENSVFLYLNGQLMIRNDFYEEENPLTGSIKFREQVYSGDIITVEYIKR